MEQKTVRDLIDFLETIPDKSMPVQVVYDGYESDLNVFIHNGQLFFSDRDLLPVTYEDANVLFRSGK